MQILSHRGIHQNAPENTLEAFEAAIALDVDGIETDIRLTCDGVPILYHDPQTPDGIQVSTQTQAQLSRACGYSIPSLGEALSTFQDQVDDAFCWNLELKTLDVFPIVLETLTQTKRQANILLTSFWHDAIAAIANQPYSLGLLWASHPYEFHHPQWFDEYSSINTMVFYQERLSADLVQACHHKSLWVYVYGDRIAADQNKLQDWQVDALITDHPNSIL